jgi:hypothetical protein
LLAPGWLASLTNSSRFDTAFISRHGIEHLLKSYPHLRSVTYVLAQVLPMSPV